MFTSRTRTHAHTHAHMHTLPSNFLYVLAQSQEWEKLGAPWHLYEVIISLFEDWHQAIANMGRPQNFSNRFGQREREREREREMTSCIDALWFHLIFSRPRPAFHSMQLRKITDQHVARYRVDLDKYHATELAQRFRNFERQVQSEQ